MKELTSFLYTVLGYLVCFDCSWYVRQLSLTAGGHITGRFTFQNSLGGPTKSIISNVSAKYLVFLAFIFKICVIAPSLLLLAKFRAQFQCGFT